MLPLLFQHFQLTKDGNDFHASISVRILCLTSCFLLAAFSLSLKNPLSVSCKAEDELTLASLRTCYPTLSEGWLNWLHYSWQVLSFRMLTRSFYLLGAARCPTPSNGIHSLFFLDAFRMLLVTWIKSLETIDLPVPEDLCSSWRSCFFVFHLFSRVPLKCGLLPCFLVKLYSSFLSGVYRACLQVDRPPVNILDTLLHFHFTHWSLNFHFKIRNQSSVCICSSPWESVSGTLVYLAMSLSVLILWAGINRHPCPGNAGTHSSLECPATLLRTSLGLDLSSLSPLQGASSPGSSQLVQSGLQCHGLLCWYRIGADRVLGAQAPIRSPSHPRPASYGGP